MTEETIRLLPRSKRNTFEEDTASSSEDDSSNGIGSASHASSLFSAPLNNNKPHNLSFHNIEYQVQERKFFMKQPPKKILLGVNGMMKPGLNAIMGPTGAGKTSLLDVLADRKPKKGLSGYVLINGRKQPNNFKCASAYVVQEDLLMGTLTVRENISFSAALRLPSSMSSWERAQRVSNVITELGLNQVADRQVGTPFIRGLPGGQKKRTSIGMELIISPGIVFLDEPTTGLDSTTSVSVVSLLKDLSNTGRVLIMSIHQPRYSIYKYLDSLTLLSFGYMIYHGPAGDTALQYFSKIGYQCEQRNNPADFYLDVIIENEVKEGLDTTNKLSKDYTHSEEYRTTKQELDVILEDAIDKPQGNTPNYATGFLWQFGVVSKSMVRNLIRNPFASAVEIVLLGLVAFIVGLFFLQVEHSCSPGIQDRTGALFMLANSVIWLCFGGLVVFITERPVFIHQNLSGYYRVSTYLLSKIFCDIIPMRTIPLIGYCVITYWMIGFQANAEKFFFFLLTFFLMSVNASAQGVLVSVNAPKSAIIILNISFLAQAAGAGFLKNIRTMSPVLSWISYISIFRFAFNAIAVNELEGQVYSNSLLINTTGRNTTGLFCVIDGTDYLENLDFLEFNVWVNIGALFGYTVLFFTLAYISLRLMQKEK